MSTRALLLTGLLVTAAAAAMERESTAASAAWPSPGTPGVGNKTRPAAGNKNGAAAVARWDGKVVHAEDDVRGMQRDAREAIETWRTFAVKRGYRVDLDETQRVLIVSDSKRFSRFSSSATIIERTLEALEPFSSPSDSPLVVLRASSEKDRLTALRAAQTLGFSSYFITYVEDGARTDRRTVDARLSEAIARQQLSLEEPFLSEWMADGVASYIADSTTGRAFVAGEARSYRSVQAEVARATGGSDSWRVSLYEVSGIKVEGRVSPRELDAFAIVAYLGEFHPDALSSIVTQLGRNEATEGRAKYRQEERAFEKYIGKTALEDLSRALREGRAYRP